jgi:hypothetical protein
MKNVLGYEVVTFQRKPGLWRASITPGVNLRATDANTRHMLSFMTPDDCSSEVDAEKSAGVAIRNLQG